MQFDPELWLRIRDKKVTAHQIKILSELALTHSQTQAAANLGISVPVLHRHLKSLVNKMAVELVTTTPNGTWLTEDGQTILKIYHRYLEMLEPEQTTAICVTPITYELLTRSITRFEAKGEKYLITMSNDEQNIKALYLGKADMVLFDDPAFAMEFEGFKDDKILTIDIFKDTLVHVDNGPEYIRYKYGAQRLGFRNLESEHRKYEILYETGNFKHILESKKSFFINQSFIACNNIELPIESDIDIDTSMFIHPIIAVSINPTQEIKKLARTMRALGVRSGDKQ